MENGVGALAPIWTLSQSIMVKKDLSQKAILWICSSIFGPPPTHTHIQTHTLPTGARCGGLDIWLLSPGHLPGEGDPGEDLGRAGWNTSPRWPGSTSGSPWKRWMMKLVVSAQAPETRLKISGDGRMDNSELFNFMIVFIYIPKMSSGTFHYLRFFPSEVGLVGNSANSCINETGAPFARL